MKINPKGRGGKPVATGIVIELDDMEAGFLRKIMYDRAGGLSSGGFASEVWQALYKYTFPNYYAKYGDSWRKLDEEEDD